MPPLGALSQAWAAAEASLPLGWQMIREARVSISSESATTANATLLKVRGDPDDFVDGQAIDDALWQAWTAELAALN